MNFKDLFKIAYRLISSPAKAWEEIIVSKKSAWGFVFSMMMFACFANFIGSAINSISSAKDFNPLVWFNGALGVCCVPFFADFFGFFLALWLLRKADAGLFGHKSQNNELSLLAGYSMVVVFVLQIIEGLINPIFQDFMLLKYILQFYIIYVVWEGVKVMHIASAKRYLSYTVVTSFIILVSVWFVGEMYTIAYTCFGVKIFK